MIQSGVQDATCIECAEAKKLPEYTINKEVDATCIECAEAKVCGGCGRNQGLGCNLYRVC